MAEGSVPAQALAYLLEQTARSMHALGYAAELFPAQWSALRYFDRADPDHRTASALARFQGMATGPVTRTVRTLIAKGYLAKSGSIGRGRAERIELTEAGRSLLAADPLADVASALEPLDEADRTAVARALEGVLRRLQERPATVDA